MIGVDQGTPLWPESAIGGPAYISSPPPPAYSTAKARHVTILGSTGSIGRNALAVAEQRQNIRICALGAGDNMRLLAQQALRWRPQWLAVRTEELAADLRNLLPDELSPKIVWGPQGYATLATLPDVDTVLSAQCGEAGLVGTLAAALAGKVIALANKESLVLAGGLLRKICKDTGAAILPVDSEHFALFQCVAGRCLGDVSRLILTASGGPFLRQDMASMATATPEAALNHPNWRMGPKISVDSATMMNKGLEFIEAVQLFGLGSAAVQILIQPQSVIHSLVEFGDHGMLAQLAVADMRLPIAACLCWPFQAAGVVPPLDLAAVGQLEFLQPDEDKFPAVRLARMAVEYMPPPAWTALGLNPACITLNAANEAAVELFLRRRCPLTAIPHLVEAALQALVFTQAPTPLTLPHYPDPGRQAVALARSLGCFTAQVRAWTEATASPVDM